MTAHCLADCQARHCQNPAGFDAPGPARLAALAPGDIVKVIAEFPPAYDPLRGTMTGAERFWVILTEVGEGRLAGTIDNTLDYTRHHGLRLGDRLVFEPRHVAAIYPRDDAAERG